RLADSERHQRRLPQQPQLPARTCACNGGRHAGSLPGVRTSRCWLICKAAIADAGGRVSASSTPRGSRAAPTISTGPHALLLLFWRRRRRWWGQRPTEVARDLIVGDVLFAHRIGRRRWVVVRGQRRSARLRGTWGIVVVGRRAMRERLGLVAKGLR